MTATSVRRTSKQIPTYDGRSILGVGRTLMTRPLQVCADVFGKHGDIARVRLFANQYLFLVSHPDLIRVVFGTESANFTKEQHPGNALLSVVMGNGLITSDGELWARQRRMAQPAFTRERVARYGELMTAGAVLMLERWDGLEAGGQLDVSEEMMRLTLQVVGRALFDMDLTTQAARVGKAFTEAGELLGELLGQPSSIFTVKVPFLPSTRRLLRSVRALDDIVGAIVADRRASGSDGEDLLSVLIRARDTETGYVMDDHQLRDEVKSLLLGGYETTAHTLSWCFHLLSQHEAIRTRLEDEVDSVLGGRAATVADLPQLVYTKMVIQEAMRLYPPIYMLGRWGHQATDVGGYSLPADANVVVSPYVVHRHPEFWPDPEKFDPERFDPGRFTPGNVPGGHRYAYIPFGCGPRQCIGSHFAPMEAQILLATIAQRYRLEAKPGWRVEPGTLTTMRPRGGLPMLLVRR